MHPLLRHLGSLALAFAFAILLLPEPAQAAAMTAPTGFRPKDFAFVKKDGVYHLFYIRHNDFYPAWATELDFGHAISTDLYEWTHLPPVMGVEPGGWDNLHVWAPHVVEWGGLWWMFYTGITDSPGQFHDAQRMGVAVSSDLMTWNRVHAAPVWSTQGAPWAWWAPLRPAMACRDPFVMPDPAAPGQWLMYYTASPASDTIATLVGVARSSTGDLGAWQDEKPLWITHRSQTYNIMTESPHLFEHGGRWFMFITANATQGLTFFTSANPLGEPSEWIYRGRLSNMLGYDTSPWFASETLKNGDQDLFAFAADDRIELRRIEWGVGDNFSLVEPSLFHMSSMEWTRPTVREHQFVGLNLRGTNGYAFTGPLVAWVRDPAGNELPAPLDSLGLPARPELSADSALVPWFTRRWPASLPDGQPMQVRVAMQDATASTPWLNVYDNPIETLPAEAPGGTLADSAAREFPPPPPPPQAPVPMAEDTLPISPWSLEAQGTGGGPTGVRVLRGSPLGGGTAVAFNLAAGGEARVELFDLQGRRLATLADRPFARGAHVVPWDGRDASGSRVPRGLYFVRLVTRDRVAAARFLVER